MRRRLLAASLALVLLLAQQLGAAHLVGHLAAPAAPAQAAATPAPAAAPGELHGNAASTLATAPASDPAADTAADAGDALCQVCLVLATLVAAGLPLAWGWQARQAPAAAPRPPAAPAPQRPAPRRWLARGPPGTPALT